MYRSKILSKLRKGKIARLANLNQLVTYFPHHAAKLQYDGVWLDAEHNTWNPREIQYLLAIHRLADIDCIVRAPTREKVLLYQLLENGATGLMLPHVSSGSEAVELVNSVKFPPIGERGLGGAGLDQNFKVNPSEEYPVKANRETLLIVQIETLEGMDAVGDIAATDGVDALFLGAEDLSLRIGCANDCGQPELRKAQREVDLACKRHGKVWGRPCRDQDDIVDAANAGARLLAHGSLFSAVSDHLERCAAAFGIAEDLVW